MGPLDGIRVVEFEALGPVPFCGMLLADHGADVVQVLRRVSGTAYADIGGAVLDRNRRSVRVDLKAAADRDAVLRLVGAADVVLEGFRPGVMERLGLGPDRCLAANPALVYGRMTGWGQTGPLAARAGHDLNYIALTGALHAMGEPGEPPPVPLNLVGDYGGGAMFLGFGVMAALIASRTTGRGQVVDAAMTDGSALLLSMFHGLRHAGEWSDRRGANLLDGGAPFYRCYACADGGHVAVGALEPQFFAALLAGLGLAPDAFVQNDRDGWPAMRACFEAAFLTRSRDAWATAFEGIDACVSPVLGFAEAARHPHNLARGTFSEAGGVLQAAPAPRFGATPAAEIRPPAGPDDLAAVIAGWERRAASGPEAST